MSAIEDRDVANSTDPGGTGPITVRVASEVATLNSVVMCLANPMSVLSFLRQGGFDAATLFQARRNRWSLTHDHGRVRAQQGTLIEVLEAHGVDVLYADPVAGSLTQHYTRDIGFVIDDVFFCARPRRRQRRRELEGLRGLLPRFSRVVHLECGSIEGGDVIVDARHVIVGLGEETDAEGVECLRRSLADLGIDREVKEIDFAHRGTIHLDTRFNLLSEGLALIHSSSFEERSLGWLRDHYELIEVTDDEALGVEVNMLTLAPEKVVVSAGSRRLASLFESRGITPILVDFSEVTRLPGAFRCVTLPIERGRSGTG